MTNKEILEELASNMRRLGIDGIIQRGPAGRRYLMMKGREPIPIYYPHEGTRMLCTEYLSTDDIETEAKRLGAK